MELLAAFAEHAVASDRRMGPPAFWEHRRPCRATARRARKLAGPGQTRPCRECCAARAALGHSATRGTPAKLGARGIAAPAIGGVDQLADGGRQGAAGGAG